MADTVAWAGLVASSTSRCTAPAARRPSSKVAPAGEDQRLVKCRRTDHHLAATPGPEGEPSTSRWSGPLDLLLCFSPHRSPSSHHTCVYLAGSGPSVCCLAVSNWAFPSEAQFKYSPGPRPRSIEVDQANQTGTVMSTHLHVAAAVAVTPVVVGFAWGWEKGGRGPEVQGPGSSTPARLSNTQHHARPLERSLGTLPLLSPARWEGGKPSPHHRTGVTMSCSSVACEAVLLCCAAYYCGTKTTAPAHHTTKTKCVTGLRCPPPNLLVTLLSVPSTTQAAPAQLHAR